MACHPSRQSRSAGLVLFLSFSLWLVASNSDNSGTLEMSQHEAGRIAITQADAARAEHARYVDEWMRTNWKPITSQYKMPNKTGVGERERERGADSFASFPIPILLLLANFCTNSFALLDIPSPLLRSFSSIQDQSASTIQTKRQQLYPPLASMPYATRPSSSRPQRSGQSQIVCVYHGGDVNAGQDSLCIYNAVQKGSRRQEKRWPCVCVCVVGIVKSSQR